MLRRNFVNFHLLARAITTMMIKTTQSNCLPVFQKTVDFGFDQGLFISLSTNNIIGDWASGDPRGRQPEERKKVE